MENLHQYRIIIIFGHGNKIEDVGILIAMSDVVAKYNEDLLNATDDISNALIYPGTDNYAITTKFFQEKYKDNSPQQ